MKIKVAPRPLPRTPAPLPRPGPLPRSGGAAGREPVRWVQDDTRRWYEALGRLVGVSAEQAFRHHFPGQFGPPYDFTVAAFARVHVTAVEILAELKRTRTL